MKKVGWGRGEREKERSGIKGVNRCNWLARGPQVSLFHLKKKKKKKKKKSIILLAVDTEDKAYTSRGKGSCCQLFCTERSDRYGAAAVGVTGREFPSRQ